MSTRPVPDPTHDHVVLHLSDGTRIVYNDPRRFGFMMMMPHAERRSARRFFATSASSRWATNLTAEYLASRAARQKGQPQGVSDGPARRCGARQHLRVGSPFSRRTVAESPCQSLADRRGKPASRAITLVVAIRDVLQHAIDAGGSTLRDYRIADGASGAFQNSFAVYDRAGRSVSSPDVAEKYARRSTPDVRAFIARAVSADRLFSASRAPSERRSFLS